MNAEDTFFEMGYEMYHDPTTLNYCNDERDGWTNFTFDLWNKVLEWYSDNKPLYVNIEMFKAVLKQFEELKWLEGIEEVTLTDLGYERVDLSTFIHYQKMNGEKIISIDFVPRSKTFTCEEDMKPLVIDPKLFKAILNEVKSLGWLKQ